MNAVFFALVLAAIPPWPCDDVAEFRARHLESSCVLKAMDDEATFAQRLHASWSLDEEQTHCAVSAANRKRAWSTCIERWPDVVPFWLSALVANERVDRFIDRTRFDTRTSILAMHPFPIELWRAIERMDQGRLVELSKHNPDVARDIALIALEERRTSLTSADWKLVSDLVIGAALSESEPQWAAELFLQLPDDERARIETDQWALRSGRLWLALGLISVGHIDPARRMVQVAAEANESLPSLRAALQWALSGQRDRTPWEAVVTVASDFSAASPGTALVLQAWAAPHVLITGLPGSARNDWPPLFAKQLEAARRRSAARWKPTKMPALSKEITQAVENFLDLGTLTLRATFDGADHLIIDWYSTAQGGLVRLDRRGDGTFEVTELNRWIS